MSAPTPCAPGKTTYKGLTTLLCSDGDNGRLRRSIKCRRMSTVEDIFIRSLVLAGSCRTCAESGRPFQLLLGSGIRSSRRPWPSNHMRRGKRYISSSSRDAHGLGVALHPEPEDKVTREEYKKLVSTYEHPSDLWEHPSQLDPHHRPPSSNRPTPPARAHVPLAPRLVIPLEQEDEQPYTLREVLPPVDQAHAGAILKLEELLQESPLGKHNNKIWNLYENGETSARYLSDYAIRRLFRHLSWVEFKNQKSSKRYFRFLEDCLAAGVTVTTNEWNTAIAFAGRWARQVTSEEVKRAVETWMDMEQHGVNPSKTTFNILFDVASRAGRFALADVVLKELKARDLPLNRYFWTSAIFNAGLKRDADAVRRAFRDLVNAGEIVDTAIMNCVILSLVRAGEGASAENVFEKMKNLHATKFEGKHKIQNWRQRKELGRELNRTARWLRGEKREHESSFFGSQYSNEEHKEAAQRLAPIHPDARTCRILLRYHCVTSGNLEAVRELISELKGEQCGGKVHGACYLSIFDGFWKWGGHAHTAWNRASLEQYWDEFIHAVQFENRQLPIACSQTSASTKQQAIVDDPESRSSPASRYNPFLPDTVPPALPASTPLSANPVAAEDFEAAVEEEIEYEGRPASFSPIVAGTVIRAFYKCAGPKKVLAVWAQIQELWIGMSEDERTKVAEDVKKVIADDYTRWSG